MPSVEISVDRDPVARGKEFAVALRTSAVAPATAENGGGAAYAIVLDASQSMGWPAEQSGNISRWTLALQAITVLLGRLRDHDEIQVVAFSDQAWTLCSTTTAAALRDSGTLSSQPTPELGMTNIEAALRLAYDLLSRSTAGARRAILFSDGEPNRGACSPGELAAIAAQAADRDIYTDAVGMGAGANFELLQAISALGSTSHVTSADGAQAAINEIVGRLAQQSQNLAASGGELTVGVHPAFPVNAVYQVNPVRKRLPASVSAAPDGGQQVVIPLGAVGTRDEQPMFVLRLRAPDQLVGREVHIVTATGRLRTRSGVVDLDEAKCAIAGVADGSFVNLEYLMPTIRSIDMEADVAASVRTASPSAHADIYADAKDRALSEGLSELAGDYEAALQGLRMGLDPNDVRSGQRASSSTSRTTPNELLQPRPKRDPQMGTTQTLTTRVLNREKPRGEPNVDF